MAQIEYSLSQLAPQINDLLIGLISFNSAEGLSAAFVLLLLIATTIFAATSIVSYLKAKAQLRFYHGLISGVSAEQLLEKQREITNSALKNNKYGQLWREFDESLVHVPHKGRLFNTLDAAHFFNASTIAKGLTESRLLAAVPGFLTAIGVIGTFAGLQMGLANLSGSIGDSPEIEELKSGIFGMIGGASIAFMTSVWGVFTSLSFNLFEKILERSIRVKITTFQNQVDFLYPRITAEQSLSNIEDYSRQSTEKLSELDEKIGHRLQEAMREASDTIRKGMEESLTSILGPAIEKLVDTAHTGSEKALENLMDRYLEGIGSAGNAQKEMMEDASRSVHAASNSMVEGMSGFMAGLEKQMLNTAEKNVNILDDFQRDIVGRMNEQQDRDLSRQSALNEQILSFTGSQDQLVAGIAGMLSTQKQQNFDLNEELNKLVVRFGELASAHEHATKAMQESSSEMRVTSVQMNLMSSNGKEAAKHLGDSVEASVRILGETSAQNTAIAERYSVLTQQMEEVSGRLDGTVITMSGAAAKADEGMALVGAHFDTLGESLRTHVEELESQVARLLTDYAERVNNQTTNRLNVWNEQTNAYIGSMTAAVSAIGDVVDEIDSRVGRAP